MILADVIAVRKAKQVVVRLLPERHSPLLGPEPTCFAVSADLPASVPRARVRTRPHPHSREGFPASEDLFCGGRNLTLNITIDRPRGGVSWGTDAAASFDRHARCRRGSWIPCVRKRK